MKKNKFIIILLVFFIGCKNRETKLEISSLRNRDNIDCKIVYIFCRGGALEFYPCKSFSTSDLYGGLRTNNLEIGFQQKWSLINYREFRAILNSADTFLLKYNDIKAIDTLLIVPAYVEYKEDSFYSSINDSRRITQVEYKFQYLDRTLHLKALLKTYQINKILPLKPYEEKPLKSSKDTLRIM